jgi:GTP cyclohydrolase I/GTP cyclohydrolase-4
VPEPAARPALSRVGLTGVETVLRLGVSERAAQPFAARIDCLVEPERGRPAAGEARFDDVIIEVLREIAGGTAAMRAERLARDLAEALRGRLDAPRAEVTIAARFPENRPAPVSGIATQEISTLHARAVASAGGTRTTVGVSAQGLTTAPHAQRAIAADARERLAADGFSDAEIAQVLDRVPVATHDQRGTGTLKLECPEDCAFVFDVPALLEIVEGAMSSEIFELMKRSDEGAVVERAHRRPRTPADCVRAMIAGAVERFAELPDAALVSARQESFETVHRHCVTAERADTLGALRREAGAAR